MKLFPLYNTAVITPLQLAQQIRNTYTHAHTYMYVFRHESIYIEDRGQC